MAKISLSSKKDNPKGYKTSTRDAMKESGARYSVTNSKGVTSLYKSGSDVDNGVAPIKKIDRATGQTIPTITSQSLQPTDKLQFPRVDVPQVSSVEASLLSSVGIQPDTTTQTTQPTVSKSEQPYFDLLNQHLSSFEAPPSTADIYEKLAKENKLKQKQQDVANYSSQLNAITSSRDAEILKLEGQGRGQTQGFIGGEQARINREAAIAALPVQAQLATAQGNLEMAQSHVDRLFQIHAQDAQAQYQYRTRVVDMVFQYANQAEQRRLEEIRRQEDRAYDEKNRNLAMANQWAMQAIEYGQSGLAGRIMGLDPKSPTYSQDLARLQGQLSKPVAPGPAISTQVIDLGGSKALINSKTGEIIQQYTGSDDGKAVQRLENRVNDAEIVIKKVLEAKGKVGFTTSGVFGGVSGKVPGTKAYDLNRTIDTIKSKIGFEALQAMREASPTGGALGQVAVQELNMLQSTIASLDIGQNQQQLKANLSDVQTHYTNWLKTVGYTVAPDGTVIQITN